MPPRPALIRTIPTDIHLAANGASDLFVLTFGDKGEHARTSTGMPVLSLNPPSEIEVIARLE